MDALIWIMLPLITAVGSALLAFYIMQARLEVVVAKEREALVEARAMMKNHERQLEDRVRVAEEETKRRSFDAFLGDIRVEERHYMRENKSLFTNTKSMVLQERLYFRNLPLSNWIEHELTVEQGQTADLANLARAASVFSSQAAALASTEAAGALPVPGRAETPAPRQASPADSGAPFGSPAANGAFGTGGNRRAFGAPRGATSIAKVAPILEEHYGDHQDAPAGQVAFSNRISGSRLIRG